MAADRSRWVVVRLINSATEQTDLTGSAGFWLTYSATADLWVQLRPAPDYNGGDKWVTKTPGTGGKMVTQFFPFTAASWFYLNVLGVPTYPSPMRSRAPAPSTSSATRPTCSPSADCASTS
jgi:hypothetical protein